MTPHTRRFKIGWFPCKHGSALGHSFSWSATPWISISLYLTGKSELILKFLLIVNYQLFTYLWIISLSISYWKTCKYLYCGYIMGKPTKAKAKFRVQKVLVIRISLEMYKKTYMMFSCVFLNYFRSI